MKVSNKLLGEVLEKNIVDSKYMSINRNIYYHEKDVIYAQTVNIYELAHKCKEYAFNKGYYLSSYYDSTGCGCEVEHIAGELDTPLLLDEEADTEPEAIFKSCEWILKEKK